MKTQIMKYFNALIKFLLIILFVMPQIILAQEKEGSEKEEENEIEWKEARHFISLSFGYTYIPGGAEVGETEANGFLVPSIGLDYLYKITPRWEIGTMMDVELDHYLVVDKELERENAFIAAIIGLYKVTPRFSLFAGGGIEIEHNHNLAVLRVGADSPIPLGREWILAPTLIFDFKEGYDTWSMAVSIGKEF